MLCSMFKKYIKKDHKFATISLEMIEIQISLRHMRKFPSAKYKITWKVIQKGR